MKQKLAMKYIYFITMHTQALKEAILNINLKVIHKLIVQREITTRIITKHEKEDNNMNHFPQSQEQQTHA